MPSIKVPTIYEPLKERREQLRRKLIRLTNEQFVRVDIESDTTEDDLPRAIIRGSIRVRRTQYRFNLFEDFRDSAGNPFLYGFTYSLQPLDATLEAMFRYECHPDVDDPPSMGEERESEGDEDKGAEDKRNPYGIHPHFHPHNITDHPISRLHYPFHRSERSRIVFHLISWIETDLVKRFYDSGRVKVAS